MAELATRLPVEGTTAFLPTVITGPPAVRTLRNLVAWTGASVPEAVATVTATPARLLGVTDRGVVEPGAVADLVVLDDRLEIESVVVRGDRVR